LTAPPADAHKYRRGLLGIVAGAMPGAAQLAATAALRGGAGYVRVLAGQAGLPGAPPELVVRDGPLEDVLADSRFAALLVGPGLGRDDAAAARLAAALAANEADGDRCRCAGAAGAGHAAGNGAGADPARRRMQVWDAISGLSGQGERPARAVARWHRRRRPW
jgi:hypothetical protein